MFFEDHIREISRLKGRPYDTPPDYESMVQIVMDPREAARHVRTIHGLAVEKGTLVAFDYENDRLKPDHPKAEIVCCSVSNGTSTVAFPWTGPVIKAVRDLLEDGRVGKIASKMSHEHRWASRNMGAEVKNWAWDTMVSAHVQENASKVRKITGLKFQAFCKLGVDSYDDHIKPYLKADGGNERNRIREVDIRSLLRYCGYDSLLEWNVAEIQMGAMR
jgi:hypothetical protein